MMTKKEATIVSAYTGFLLVDFSNIHKYAEKIMKRPIFRHEFADIMFVDKLKTAAKQNFVSIEIKDD